MTVDTRSIDAYITLTPTDEEPLRPYSVQVDALLHPSATLSASDRLDIETRLGYDLEQQLTKAYLSSDGGEGSTFSGLGTHAMKSTGKVTSTDGREWDWAVDKVIFLCRPGHTHEVDAILQRGPGPDRPISCTVSLPEGITSTTRVGTFAVPVGRSDEGWTTYAGDEDI